MVLIFLIHFFSHDIFTIPPPWKLNDGSVPFPRYANTLQTVGSKSLSSINESNPTTSTHSRRKYWAFFQHCLSIDDICFDRILFTFLTTEISDSTFWKFSFKRLISVVSEAIVVLACFWVLRNKSIIWFLFNALSVSSVHTLAITSIKLLQWQKIAVK